MEGLEMRTHFGERVSACVGYGLLVLVILLAGYCIPSTAAEAVLRSSSVGERSVSFSYQLDDLSSGSVREPLRVARFVAVPYSGSYSLEVSGIHESFLNESSFQHIGRMRDQDVGLLSLSIDPRGLIAAKTRQFDVRIGFDGRTSGRCLPVGSLTRVAREVLDGYDLFDPVETPPSIAKRTGSASRLYSLSECISASLDYLIISADSLFESAYLDSLALARSSYYGINVGIVSTDLMEPLSPQSVKSFIQSLYDSESAANFGDGHLGVLLLVGDAFADDDSTVMMPDYDGYGGTEEASDHYYALLEGDDEFEDLLLSRLSVGNESELAAAVNKLVGYMPLPEDDWSERVLLIAGRFFASNDDYVELFDDFDERIPHQHQVDRIYRYDYDSNSACQADVVDAFNEGYLIVNYSGDGCVWCWDGAMYPAGITGLANQHMYPFVFSMACATGWFDNLTPDATGLNDCLAERLVNADEAGAIACLASSRNSDGGIFKTLNEYLFEACYEGQTILVSETAMVAKLNQLRRDGHEEYPRQFNLFGEPLTNFRMYEPPPGYDIVIKPHTLEIVPATVSVNNPVEVKASVTNQGVEPLPMVRVRVYDGDPALGVVLGEDYVFSLTPWGRKDISLTVTFPYVGAHTIYVVADPDEEVLEPVETNNIVSRDFYVYSTLPGFPADLESGLRTPVVGEVSLRGGKEIVVGTNAAEVDLIAADAGLIWYYEMSSAPIDQYAETSPAIGDIDGDGTVEVIATSRMAVSVVDTSGQEFWSVILDDPVASPSLGDVDGDGDLDIVLATKNLFWGTSSVLALDDDGGMMWRHEISGPSFASTLCALSDLTGDGIPEVVYGSVLGVLRCMDVSSGTPVHLWTEQTLGTGNLTAPVVADLDTDGTSEIVVGGDAVYARSSLDGSEIWMRPLPGVVVAVSVGDIEGDGTLEVVAGLETGDLFLLDSQGDIIWQKTLFGAVTSSPAIADLDNDDFCELAVTCENGYLYMIESDGTDYVDPAPVSQGYASSPVVADIDSNGLLDVTVSSEDELLYVLEFGQNRRVEWAMLGQNARHTNSYTRSISGTVSSDAVWCGSVNVVDDLEVAPGVTLTLMPGTVLSFRGEDSGGAGSPSGYVDITVHGSLEALGTTDLPVIFKPCSEDPSAMLGGIYLEPGASANLLNCNIERAWQGVSANSAALVAEDCIIERSNIGMMAAKGDFTLSGVRVHNPSFAGLVALSSRGLFEDCQVLSPSGFGIVSQFCTKAILESCVVESSGWSSGFWVFESDSVSVRNSSFGGNFLAGIDIESSNVSIDSTVLVLNGECGVKTSGNSSLYMRNCTVDSNPDGIVCLDAAVCDLGDLSSGDGGMNEVTNFTGYAVSNLSATEVKAELNWWGSEVPTASFFKGQVDFAPWLTGPGVTGAGGEAVSVYPSEVCLRAPSPNPATARARIQFDVPAPGLDVRIRVFNVRGELVRTLVDGSTGPGRKWVGWNGLDSRGRQVSSGTYFVLMEAPGYSSSEKLVLLR